MKATRKCFVLGVLFRQLVHPYHEHSTLHVLETFAQCNLKTLYKEARRILLVVNLAKLGLNCLCHLST